METRAVRENPQPLSGFPLISNSSVLRIALLLVEEHRAGWYPARSNAREEDL